jgi:hypothetical protein
LPMTKDAHWSCFQSSLQQYQCSRMTPLHQAQQRRLVAGSFIPLRRLFAPASQSHLFPYLKFLTLNPLYWVDQSLDEKTDSVCMEVWEFQQEGTTINHMGSRTNHMHNLTELVWQALETQVNLSLSLTLTFMFFLKKCIWSIYHKQWVHSWCGHFSMAVKTSHQFSHQHSHKCPLMLGWKRQEEQGPCNFQMILTTSQT